MIDFLLIGLIVVIVSSTWLVLKALEIATTRISARLIYIAKVLEGKPPTVEEEARFGIVGLEGESYRDFLERTQNDRYGVDDAAQWLAQNSPRDTE